MRRHLRKREFKFVGLTVMALEVAAFLTFIFGTLGAVLGTYSGISTTDFILIGFGGITVAFLLLSLAEILQVLMKLEFNTRHPDRHDELVERELELLKKEDAKINRIWMLARPKKASAVHKPAQKISGKKNKRRR